MCFSMNRLHCRENLYMKGSGNGEELYVEGSYIKWEGFYTRITYGGTYTVQVVGEKIPVLPMGYSVSEGQLTYNEE